MKLCPCCHASMKKNDYQDYVCKCQGPLLCYPELLKRTNSLQVKSVSSNNSFLRVVGGFDTVARCQVLASLGAKWLPNERCFSIGYASEEGLRELKRILDEGHFKYYLTS